MEKIFILNASVDNFVAGTRVVVDTERKPKMGDYVVAGIEGDHICFGKIRRHGRYFKVGKHPVSWSNKFIIGRLVAFIREFE